MNKWRDLIGRLVRSGKISQADIDAEIEAHKDELIKTFWDKLTIGDSITVSAEWVSNLQATIIAKDTRIGRLIVWVNRVDKRKYRHTYLGLKNIAVNAELCKYDDKKHVWEIYCETMW